jgi:hypothetical protein
LPHSRWRFTHVIIKLKRISLSLHLPYHRHEVSAFQNHGGEVTGDEEGGSVLHQEENQQEWWRPAEEKESDLRTKNHLYLMTQVFCCAIIHPKAKEFKEEFQDGD